MAKAKKKSASPLTKTSQNPTPKVSKVGQNITPRVSKVPPNSTSRLSKSPQTSIPRLSKSPQTSTPRVSKTTTTSITSTPASRSSLKKANSSSLTGSRNPSSEKTKRIPPKTLHMSLTLDPADPTKSDSASEIVTTTRKSFIMEQMGDKDIVKRAFKTFQTVSTN